MQTSPENDENLQHVPHPTAKGVADGWEARSEAQVQQRAVGAADGQQGREAELN